MVTVKYLSSLSCCQRGAEWSAGLRRVQIQWPSSQADVQRRTVAQRALLQSWLADVHPTVFSTLSQATAVQVHVRCEALVMLTMRKWWAYIHFTGHDLVLLNMSTDVSALMKPPTRLSPEHVMETKSGQAAASSWSCPVKCGE